MNGCTCGMDGWFSPPDARCPEHGIRGSNNSDYQRGIGDAARTEIPIAAIMGVVSDVLSDSPRLNSRDIAALVCEIARRIREMA